MLLRLVAARWEKAYFVSLSNGIVHVLTDKGGDTVLRLPLLDATFARFDPDNPPPNLDSKLGLLKNLGSGPTAYSFEHAFEVCAPHRAVVFKAGSAAACDAWLDALLQHKRAIQNTMNML